MPLIDTTGLHMPHWDVRLADGRLVRVGCTGEAYLRYMSIKRVMPRGDLVAKGYGGQRGTLGVGAQYRFVDRLVAAGLLRYRYDLTEAERARTRSQAMVEITEDGLYALRQINGKATEQEV